MRACKKGKLGKICMNASETVCQVKLGVARVVRGHLVPCEACVLLTTMMVYIVVC